MKAKIDKPYIISLVPNGNPDDLRVRFGTKELRILVLGEDDWKWIAKPLANFHCPPLEYPKFAWRKVS